MRYLVIIFAFGFIAAALNRLPSRPSPSLETLAANATGVSEDASSNTSDTYASSSTDGALQLQREPNGHFFADVDVNGTKIHMLVDTGATGIALSREDARSAGIATSIGMPNVVGEGADGSIHGEYVTVDRMSLGNAKAEGVEAIVLNNGGQSLLGQSFLAKFASVEIRGDTMTLK